MKVRSAFFPLLLSLVLAFPMAAQVRRRAVRVPGGPCSFTLASAIPDPVPDGGVIRASVRVSPLVGNCTGWNATSPVSWMQVEHDASNAYVTVLPNDGTEPRAARLTIAGVWLNVTQLGHALADANLLRNGGFDRDLSNWAWRPEQFPFNGNGDESWSSYDASGSIASGSVRLRDDLTMYPYNGELKDPARQLVQCIPAVPGARYDYGFSVRTDTPKTIRAIINLLQYPENDCRGAAAQFAPFLAARVAEAGVWERRDFPTTYNAVSPGSKSILVVIGGWTDIDYARRNGDPGQQEIWIDDVYVKIKP